MCTVAINVLEPGAFNSESQYFIPLFNRSSWLCVQHPTGNEASNGGCNSGPIAHDFQDNSNIYFIFITMRIGSFSKCEIRFGFHIGCQVRTWAVFPYLFSLTWEPSIRFSLWLSYLVLTGRFSADGWEPPNTGLNHWFQFLDYFRIRELSVWMKPYKTLFINTQ